MNDDESPTNGDVISKGESTMVPEVLSLPKLDFTRIGPAVSTRFPDLVLPDQTGQLVDLHAVRAGRKALVIFYRSASWCTICKAQLVELQASLADFERAGVALFGVSYDPVAVLSAFAAKRGITFPLLSDEGSHAIRRLGLLNERLVEQQAYYGREARDYQFGVPYPGMFVLDEGGVIVEKEFEQSYRVSPASVDVLERNFGQAAKAAVRAQAKSEELQAVAWLGKSTYYRFQKLRLHVGIQVAPGLHVYGSPAPEGCVPLTISVDPLETLELGAIELPQARSLRIEVLDEVLPVYEGAVRADLPFLLKENEGEITLTVRLGYQACSHTECFPPGEVILALPLIGVDRPTD